MLQRENWTDLQAEEEIKLIEDQLIPYLRLMVKLSEKWESIVPQNTLPPPAIARNIDIPHPLPPETIEQTIAQLERKVVTLSYHKSWIEWDLIRKALKVFCTRPFFPFRHFTLNL